MVLVSFSLMLNDFERLLCAYYVFLGKMSKSYAHF